MKSDLHPVFGLMLLITIVWGAIFLITKIMNLFLSLNSDVAKAIVAAGVTGLVAILSLLISKQYEHRSQIHKEHREKKIPIYEELIDFLFRLLFSEKIGEQPPNEKEIVKFFVQFTQKLIIWGSDDVVKSYEKFRVTLLNDPSKSIFALEEVLLVIRRDLGHKNKGFKQGTILGLYINDIHDVLAHKTQISR
jgi:hypothetical protein